MSTCTPKAIKQAKNFGLELISRPEQAEAVREKHLSALKTMFSQDQAGSSKFMAKLIEASLSIPFLAYKGLSKRGTIAKIQTYIDNNALPADQIQANFKLLGENITDYDGIVTLVDTVNVSQSTVTIENTQLGNEIIAAADTDIAHNLLTKSNQTRELSVKDAQNDMATKKVFLASLVDGIKKDSPDRWAAVLQTYFPSSNKLGTGFTEWTRDSFFDMFVDFSGTNEGFVMDINTEIIRFKNRLKKELKTLSSKEYGSTNVEFLDKLLADVDLTGVRKKYYVSVLLNDFDFIIDSLIKVVGIDQRKTGDYNQTIEGFESEDKKMEPLLLNVYGKNISHLFEKMEGKRDRYALKAFVNPVMVKVSTNSAEFLNNTSRESNTFYHILGDNSYYYRNNEGADIPLNPTKYYSYNGNSSRNTSSIDHFVNPLDNSSKFINNLMPLLKIINSDGTTGRRMTVGDFVALAPLLVNIEPTHDALTARLKTLGDKNSTKIGAVARSLHSYIFSTVSTHKSKFHSIRMASRKSKFKNMNADIVNSLFSALISKHHVRYLKTEEGRTVLTKGPNEGSEGQIIDEALSGYLVGVDKYTKRGISKKLQVRGKKILVDIGEEQKVDISTITSMEPDGSSRGMHIVALHLGLEDLYNDIAGTYHKENSTEAVGDLVVSTFKSVIKVLAANSKALENRLALSAALERSTERVAIHKDYMYLSPSTLIKENDQKNLAEVFFVDSSKAQRIGDKTTQSSTTPNKNTTIKRQVATFKKFNDNRVSPTDMSHMPMLMDMDGQQEGSSIVPAEIGDVFIKAPIVYDGNVVKLSDWDLKIRLEHAMFEGVLNAPKRNVGKEFYLQITNYSDKSSPELFQITANKNLLSNDSSIGNELKNAYVEYNYRKNEALQQVTLVSFQEFIVGEYEYIRRRLIEDAKLLGVDSAPRTEALLELKELLVSTDFAKQTGDMLRPFNAILDRVRINPAIIEESNANLDMGADYMTFDDNEASFLKPTAGIRAALYRDKTTAAKLVKHYLAETRALLKKTSPRKGSLDTYAININGEGGLKSILESKPGITSNVDTFIDRFFLINGIYGHSMKTLTLGDETYFEGYFDSATQADFYAKADEDIVSDDAKTIEMAGLEGIETMLSNQFKRSQSILTRGVVYAQKETLRGLKKGSNRDNLLQHLDIYKGRGNGGKDIYRFKELEGNTLTELWGKGVISPIVEGTQILSARNAAGDLLVKFNIGTQQVVVSTDLSEMMKLRSENLPVELIEGIQDLINNRLTIEDSAVNPAQVLADNLIDVSSLRPSIVKYRDVSLSMMDIKEHYRTLEVSKGDPIVQPDFLPSMLISDPESYINLLNKMDVGQETADGIQYIHPLYYLIKQRARGGDIGAFNTKDWNAQKTLATSVEYDKNRQTLLKNSGQMPFSIAQMRKVGSVELFNAFKTMNTAIDFKQSKIIYTRKVDGIEEVDHRLAEKTINNLDDLFTYFGGYDSQGDQAWDQVLEALRQNPIDMYSFVAHINVPSNQKTGRKRFNKFDNVFAKDIAPIEVLSDHAGVEGRSFTTTADVKIDYLSNEFNFEVLTKEHEYDVSGQLNKRSSLSLLSQLVNAVAFGGLSNVDAMSLQNAMGGRMRLNRLRVGRDLAIVAKTMAKKSSNKYLPQDYKTIVDKLQTGDVSTEGYTPQQHILYEEVIRSGVYNMAQLAFNEAADSMLIKKMIEGEKHLIGDEEMITLYSLDTPAIQNKVMGTLRAAFFGDTVKMRMEGFQAVVSATHKTITIFDFNGGRKARGAYIRAGLEAGVNHDWSKEDGEIVHVNSADAETMDRVGAYVLPFDKVKIVSTRKEFSADNKLIKETQPEEYYNKSNIDINKYTKKVSRTIPGKDGSYTKVQEDLYVILTPDVLYDDAIYLDEYDLRKENDLLKVRTGLNNYDVYFKWFLEEKYTRDEINAMITEGRIKDDVTEKYSLKWYQITRKDENGDIIDIKDTDAFRDYYRAVLTNPLDEKESIKYRAAMILETQNKDLNGKPIWNMIPAEIVLPAYMKDRFGMLDEMSLHDMIGHSTTLEEQKLHLKEKLRKITPRGKRYAIITNNIAGKRNKHYSKMITRIYHSRAIIEKSSWYDDIVSRLENEEAEHIKSVVAEHKARGVELDPHEVELSQGTMNHINKRKNEAFEDHLTQLTESFMSMLDTVATRIPGQSKQSGFVGRVVEFLDAQGNAAFAPTEHIVTTGGDFDIDTLSILTKTMDAEGKVYSDEDYRDTETKIFDFDLLNDAYNEELLDVYESMGDYVGRYNKEAKDYVVRLERRIATAKTNGTTKIRIGELETSLGFAKKNEIDESRGSELIDTVISGIHSRYENILANTVANSVMGSLNKVDTAVEVNTPISMSMFKAIQARIKATFGSPIELGMSGETFWPIIKYEELAAQGKEAIGMFATALKINSAVQAAEMNYNRKYAAQHAKNDTTHPFIFEQKISFTRRNEDGTSENVTRYRKSFADLDRFNITKNVAKSYHIQEQLAVLREGEESYKEAALPTLVGIIQEEVSTSIGKTIKNVNPFTFEEKTALIEEFGEAAGTDTFDETLLLFLKAQFTKKGATDVEFLAHMEKALGKKNLRTGPNYIEMLNIRINSSLIAPTEKNIKVFNGILESTFGIEVPSYIAESTAPITELKAYLSKNPDIVENAFLYIIGKQLSNDVQSQFLSAATDNAKALILGKIRSGSLTNPVITTMMILGFEVDDIIDFLYDGQIEKILLHFAKEKSTLRRVNITSGAVTKLESYNGLAKNSLIELLEIGEQITKFRDVRSLNENAKIEPSALDKIRHNIDPDGVLYRAIIENNFKLLEIGDDAAPAVKVFNPTQMVFLHPQSRDLFMNLYESEVYKMPALFRTTIEAREQAGEDFDPITYKNIFTALAALKVEDFLNAPVKNAKGEEAWRLGEIMHQNEDGTYDPNKITRLRLDNPVNREKFVHAFPEYWKYAKSIFPGNTGLESMAFTNTYKSTKSILAIPKLKGVNIDSADAALIYDGFRELKSVATVLEDVPGETKSEKEERLQTAKELETFKIRLYNNLSLYALIVSKGEVKKGSMIEVFDEIVFELGKHLNTLSQDYYKENFRASDPIVAALMRGDVPTERELGDILIGKTRNTEGFSSEYDEETHDGREQEDMYINNDQNDADNREEDEDRNEVGAPRKSVTYSISSKAQAVMLGTSANIGQIFRVVDPNLKDAIFYSAGIGEVAYRIFDIVADEALPHSTNVSFKEHDALPFADELGKAGKQIGFKVTWKGEDAWIINYTGELPADNVETLFEAYTVQTKDKEVTIPGVFLMRENPELFLRGNIIEYKNARNIRLFNQFKEQDDATLKDLPETLKVRHYSGKIDDEFTYIFSQAELKGDPIVGMEVSLLSGVAGAVIKTTNTEETATISFDGYMENEEVPKAGFLTRNALVPSLKVLRSEGVSSIEENAIIPEIKDQIGDNINSLKVGESTSFYGLMNVGQLSYEKDDFKLVAGIAIVESFIAPFMDKDKDKKKNTLMKGAFKVKRITLKNDTGFEYRITRVGKGRFLTMVGKETVALWINPNTGRIDTNAKDNTKTTAIYKGIDKGYSKVTHSKYRITVEGKKYDAMVINYADAPKTILKVPKEGYNDEYYTVRPQTEKSKGLLPEYLSYYVSPETLASINKQITDKNVIPTNLKCN